MALERFRVLVNGKPYDVTLDAKAGRAVATLGDKTWNVDLRQYSDTSLVSLLLVERHGDTYTILRDTEQYRAQVKPAWANVSRRSEEAGAGAEITVESPLVGMVVEVRASVGQQVQRGDVLLVIEAMKMQNELRAPRAGTVKALRVKAGQKVAAKQALAVLA